MELLAVFLPLFAFLIAGLFNRQITDLGCQLITSAGVIIAALISVILFFDVVMDGVSYTTTVASWISSGEFSVNWALRIDSLSVIMMCVINIVSACVHVYSIGYMSHDAAKGRFMAYLSLFTFAMLMLVTSDNLLQLFFGWEGVGLASYLLIGFWNHKSSANAAAQKAFVVNRVGDVGLALGVMAVFFLFGTIQFDEIFGNVAAYQDMTINFWGAEFHALTTICLLLFVGAVGKSAQLGLHTWLPDAMEGPTPVSALIHAATMVTAGVFLVSRFSPVFEYAPDALMVVTIFGGLTAIVAATIGLTQFDIKRVIAYSTMSQLGYMFFALGVSAYSAAMFHLLTHAFFKALLFLGAGSVIHAMSDEQDMRNMGGIWRKIPTTYAMMWIGSLALAGIGIPFVFGMSGYYSKDIILEAAWMSGSWFGEFAFWMGIAAAFLTAFYSWRLIYMTFHGKPRASKEVMSHIHESPPVMLLPLFVLALGALLSGAMLYKTFTYSDQYHSAKVEHALDTHDSEEAHGAETDMAESHHEENSEEYSEATHVASHISDHHEPATYLNGVIPVKHENDSVHKAHDAPIWVKLLPLFMGLGGIFMATIFYIWRPALPAFTAKLFKPLHNLFFNKWYFDEIYNSVFVQNTLRLGRAFWVSGDQKTIDRFGPNGSAFVSKCFAGLLSRVQSGFIYHYAFVMMVGLIGLITWFFVRGM